MPTRAAQPKKSSFIDELLSPKGIGIIVVILITLSVGAYWLSTKKSTPFTNVYVKPTPTPYPLPQGPQTYPFSYGSAITGPKPDEVTINPYDPKKGEQQTFTVKIKYSKPITYGAIQLTTDTKKTKVYPMTLTSGTTTDGVWSATITTDDTHDYIYNVGLDFQSSTEKTSIMPELTLRAY